jgi:hypothetical protein
MRKIERERKKERERERERKKEREGEREKVERPTIREFRRRRKEGGQI